MDIGSGPLHYLTVSPEAPEWIELGYGERNKYSHLPKIGSFAFGPGHVVTINGVAVSSVGELFDWFTPGRKVTVTLAPPQASETTDFSDTK